MLPLPFFAVLRGPSRTKGVAVLRGPSRTKGVAVAVLRSPSWTKRCCRCRSPQPFAALRGQKGVAVAVLRGPSRPFVDKRCCRCRSPRPFAALRGQKVLPLPFSAALRGPPWTKGVAVAVLRRPSQPSVDKRCCRCRSPCPSAALRGQKGVAVAVLRGPSRPFADKRCCRCRSSQPFVDKRCCRACPQDTPIQPLATVDILYNLL